MSQDQKIALVTGANRGIGFEICRQLARKGIRVILTSRNAETGQAACQKLIDEALPVDFHSLDVTSTESIQHLKTDIENQYGRLDILINNAGISIDKENSQDSSVFSAKLDTLRETMETNVYGALRMCQAFVPLMKQNNYGRIVNLSSGMGQLSEMGGGYPGYRLSKTSLNALTRILSAELKDTNILVNTMCPGWVKTDMGGPHATRTVDKGAETAIWLSLLPNDGPRGRFFRDKEELLW